MGSCQKTHLEKLIEALQDAQAYMFLHQFAPKHNLTNNPKSKRSLWDFVNNHNRSKAVWKQREREIEKEGAREEGDNGNSQLRKCLK